MKMKRIILYATLAAVLCWGCTDKLQPIEEVPTQEVTPVDGPHVATLTVGMEPESGDTKATLVNDRTFQWQEGDQIGVYVYSTESGSNYGPWMADFSIQSGAGTGSAVFSRELESGLDYGNVAVYPYNVDKEQNPWHMSSYAYANDATKGTLTFFLPSVYKNLDNLDMVRAPMVAVLDMDDGGANKSDISLKHVGGVVKITLLNVPAKAKYFKLWAVNKNISGDFTINLCDVGTGTLQGNGSSNTVELQLKEGQARASLDVYFPVPAGTYQLGIGVYGDNIVYLEKTAARENTIGRGQILRMPAIDIEPNFGPYSESLPNASKASGITYQMNVYSFKDSDGDGVGDFPGIVSELDYLDKLGVTAIWLSPSQLAQSYHGYDVKDYTLLNSIYAGGGTANHTSAAAETAFRNLINAAHQHNIRIYMDYVINHTGDQHPWFQDVKQNGPASTYWNYYAVSADPYNDVHNNLIPQIPTYWDVDPYHDGRWWPFVHGGGQSQQRYVIDLDWTNASAPVISVADGSLWTLTESNASATYDNPARYLFWGNGTYTRFADNGTNKYRLVLDFQSAWGCLVRTTNDNTDWSNGTKWGFASAKEQLQLGGAGHTLTATNSNDIVMPDATLYFYYSAFYTGMMPDLNYGHASECESSPAFLAVVASIDKWLGMGLDGLRLDAIKHIYGDESGGAGSENRLFWQKFYSAVNAKYKANASKRSNLNGISDANIFMVGEVLSNDNICKPFYAGLPAIFEFQFWWDLRTALNSGKKGNFVSGLCDRFYEHRNERAGAGVEGGAISTPKLSNHDEPRTASDLYERHRIRQAATVLLTAPGRPFLYQGEELGYWGTQDNGDEYVRTPILWTSDHSSAAAGALSDKVDWDMLTPSISVASQAADEESLLKLYRRFAYARNTNPAMADGEPEFDHLTENNASIMAWYMHQAGVNWDSGKVCLVMHNISGELQRIDRWPGDNVSNSTILVASDAVYVSGKTVCMPPYSSVVFALN